MNPGRRISLVPTSDWIWHGMAGHFIASRNCCFRLHTTVGKYRVSTVGCYHPEGAINDTLHEIGLGRLFETMVFENDPDGEPTTWCEIDADAYQTAEDASAGHLAMCRKWAGQ